MTMTIEPTGMATTVWKNNLARFMKEVENMQKREVCNIKKELSPDYDALLASFIKQKNLNVNGKLLNVFLEMQITSSNKDQHLSSLYEVLILIDRLLLTYETSTKTDSNIIQDALRLLIKKIESIESVQKIVRVLAVLADPSIRIATCDDGRNIKRSNCSYNEILTLPNILEVASTVFGIMKKNTELLGDYSILWVKSCGFLSKTGINVVSQLIKRVFRSRYIFLGIDRLGKTLEEILMAQCKSTHITK